MPKLSNYLGRKLPDDESRRSDRFVPEAVIAAAPFRQGDSPHGCAETIGILAKKTLPTGERPSRNRLGYDAFTMTSPACALVQRIARPVQSRALARIAISISPIRIRRDR